MLSKKILNIQNSYSFGNGYKGGHFFTYNSKTTRAENECSCRDAFFEYFLKANKLIGFTKPNLDIKSLNEFFNKIETQLKLKKPTVFYKTTIKDVVLIEVCDFWLDNDTRRSLFTLLLRCGAVHYKGDFEYALNDYNLSKAVKPAIKWFLKGNVNPNFPHVGEGFVAKFRNVTNELPKFLTGKSLTILCKNIKMFPLYT